MRVRVASGTDGVSDLFSTSDTAACETPAASAISFWVGRALVRSPPPPPRGVRLDVVIVLSRRGQVMNSDSGALHQRSQSAA